jgi:hypothetical protein
LNDLIVSDGERLIVAGQQLDPETGQPARQRRFSWLAGQPHIMDRSWHTGVATKFYGNRQQIGQTRGQLVVADGSRVFGFGIHQPDVWGGPKNASGSAELFANDLTTRKRLWTVNVPAPFQIEAMAVAGDVLLAAGPVDRLNRLAGRLWLLSTKDRTRWAEHALPSPPAADGLAVADNRVYVSTQDGRLLCFGRTAVKNTSAR